MYTNVFQGAYMCDLCLLSNINFTVEGITPPALKGI